MSAPRGNNFDALRLVGALLVLFSHQFAVSGRPEPRLVGDHSFATSARRSSSRSAAIS